MGISTYVEEDGVNEERYSSSMTDIGVPKIDDNLLLEVKRPGAKTTKWIIDSYTFGKKDYKLLVRLDVEDERTEFVFDLNLVMKNAPKK